MPAFCSFACSPELTFSAAAGSTRTEPILFMSNVGCASVQRLARCSHYVSTLNKQVHRGIPRPDAHHKIHPMLFFSESLGPGHLHRSVDEQLLAGGMECLLVSS